MIHIFSSDAAGLRIHTLATMLGFILSNRLFRLSKSFGLARRKLFNSSNAKDTNDRYNLIPFTRSIYIGTSQRSENIYGEKVIKYSSNHKITSRNITCIKYEELSYLKRKTPSLGSPSMFYPNNCFRRIESHSRLCHVGGTLLRKEPTCLRQGQPYSTSPKQVLSSSDPKLKKYLQRLKLKYEDVRNNFPKEEFKMRSVMQAVQEVS